jgi:CRP-like cAMP-binding protein
MQFIIKSTPEFLPWHRIQVSSILEGVVTYEILYECHPKILNTSNGLVNLTMIRYLKAAGISLYRLEAQKPLVDFTDVQNRLLDSSSFGILKFLTEDEILALSKTAELKYFYEGKPVIQKGAQEDWMYIVSEGVLEVRILDQHGVSKVVSNLWPGDIVGEMSMLTGDERSADVYASKDSILLEISKENMAPILNANPELLQKFSDILAKRQAQNEYFASAESQVQKIAENSKNIRAKIINFFLRR